VATLLSSPPGPRSGGPGNYVIGLTDALRRNSDLELVLIAPDTLRGATGQRVSQMLLALQQLIRLLSVRPDAVHVHDHPALLAAAVAYRQLSGGSARVIYTSHLDLVEPRALWKRLIVGWLLSRCSTVTVVAHNSIDKLGFMAEPIPAREIVRVVPGAATVRVRDKSDPEVVEFAASIGHRSGPVILQVSNFVYPAKVAGVLRLMEALTHVRRRFPNVRLLLLGTGPLVDRVQQACEHLGLAESVTIPGTFIPDLSLPVGLSDIHCHISLQDACPISVIEAMHAGKPIVTSPTGGIPDMIQHNVTGVLVDDEPEHIAGAIVDLLEHPDKARAMGARAQRYAQSKFTWDRVGADFKPLYGAPPSRTVEAPRTELCDVAK
jgi:glycosyltransferase involved in cell wall biosynthesis